MRARPHARPDAFLDPIGPRSVASRPSATIALLNDSRDQLNYGAQALVDGLIAVLTEHLPGTTLLPVPSHWLRDSTNGMRDMVDGGTGLQYRHAAFPEVADQFETVADDWLSGAGGSGADDFLERMRAVDLVLLNGEGSLYRRNRTAMRELFLAWFAKECLGIPTAYVNGGLHLTDVVPILPAMVRKTFGAIDVVAVREAPSLRNLREFVPGVDARLFPDSAFALTTDDARRSTVTPTVDGSPYFCFDPGAMPIDVRGGERSALYELVSALQQVTPNAVFVVSSPNDRYVEPIARATGSVFVETITDYREFMSLVAGAQFLVSGRYHNVILAAMMGCPSIAFGSTTHKVHGACEMLDGLVGTPYDGTALRPEVAAITRRAAGYVEARAELSSLLEAVCSRRRTELVGLATLVGSLLPEGM